MYLLLAFRISTAITLIFLTIISNALVKFSNSNKVFHGGLVEESTGQCKRCGFDPWVGKIPWMRKWQTTPVFLTGKSHGQWSRAEHSPWGHKRVGHDLATKQQLRTTEFLSNQVSILMYWAGQKVRLGFSTRHKNVLANQTHGCTPSFKTCSLLKCTGKIYKAWFVIPICDT